MSKKSVIVPKSLWTVVVDFGDTNARFYWYKSRASARSQAFGCPVHKVTKIVYYYE